jgi:hypothetical protein
MAVKRCPSCGDLYLAAVDVCAECGATLVVVEERSDDASPPTGIEGGEGHETWELEAWTMEGRRLIDGMLTSAGIPRAWQGATLVTPRSVHDQVEEMVAVVARADARVGVDDQTLAAADADAGVGVDETVGYEVSDWDQAALDRLVELLDRDGIAHGWDDDGDLVVATAHEAAVDAIFAEFSDGATDDGEVEEGPEAMETLSELFLATDSLARNPLDMAACRSVLGSAERLSAMRLPFGFAPKVWESILEQAAALADQIESDGLDDDAVEQRAAALRATLRDYI